jgi:hypothetical protein
VLAVASALALVVLVLGDSRLLHQPRLVDGPRVRRQLERQLRIPLSAVPPVLNSSTMPNVTATYSGEVPGQRLLVVVFDSDDAVVQISRLWNVPFGENARAFRRKNAVVLYAHQPGKPDRASAVSAALEAAAAG